MDRKYAIDANMLISSSRKYYSFEIAPSFWRQLIEKGRDKIILVDKIKDEICNNEDQLSSWLKFIVDEGSFIISNSNDPKILQNYSKIISNVQSNNQYFESAKIEFASVGDSWLCAHAMTYGYVIVTLETYERFIKKRIKIPNVCIEFNIEYIDLMQFMKEIGIIFN